MRTYTELCRLRTYEERFNYLRLYGNVGNETFGAERYLNQKFYHSMEWRQLRNKIILRDNGCDLGLPGYEIYGHIVIHHLEPILCGELKSSDDYCRALDAENLICVSQETHRAIHYGGDEFVSSRHAAERRPNDTCPWKQ